MLQHLSGLHRETFSTPAAPVLPPAMVDGQQAILARHIAKALVGIGVFRRSARRTARKAAAWTAYREIDHTYQTRVRERAAELDRLKQVAEQLRANDPDAVLASVAAAFEDNEASAAPLGVDGKTLSVAVLLPPKDDIPERLPTRTPAGNWSLPKMTKTQIEDWYKTAACGFVLATVKEAFAVAVGIDEVTAVAVRRDGRAAECILVATITRSALHNVDWRWDSTSALQAAASSLLVNPRGRTGGWAVLDLTDEPDLLAALRAVELADND